ncbi:DUF5329 family protein [Acidovorax sp.]|uniref:DUF5329 family protein n=1 Tax=Acidovorax sp. TaxID=1872122 RepID=UPI003D053DF9
MLTHLESSGCKFNRNAAWYSGQEARRHLQRKLEQEPSASKSLEPDHRNRGFRRSVPGLNSRARLQCLPQLVRQVALRNTNEIRYLRRSRDARGRQNSQGWICKSWLPQGPHGFRTDPDATERRRLRDLQDL